MDTLDLSDATLTFLFSDIEGSTRLEQEIGTGAYADVRERQRTLLRAAFAACGGDEQGTEGDSFFVVFRTARGALTAAVAAQRAIAAEPWPADARIRVRMGIHSGEARAAGGSLVGIDINRAARIAGVAHGGQILVSDATRALVHGEALDGIAFRDLGPHRLKDLLEPAAAVPARGGRAADRVSPDPLARRAAGQPADAADVVRRPRSRGRRRRTAARGTPAGDADRSRRHGEDPSGAAGRRRRFRRLRRWRLLREPRRSSRPGARRLADRHQRGSHRGRQPPDPRPPGGLADRARRSCWCSTTSSRSSTPPRWSQISSGQRRVSRSWSHRGPRCGSPASTSTRCPACPHRPTCRTLTALERAQLPVQERTLDADALAAYESVELFVARATAVRPGFRVTNENAAAVAAICARLRGMPLAIELAAARVRLLTPEAILGRLTHQLAILAGGSRDLPERQQTLRAAIAWSYDILDEPRQRLLERLSVFWGGIDLAAAEAVGGTGGMAGEALVDAIGDLVDQSLLRVRRRARAAVRDARADPRVRRRDAGRPRGGRRRARPVPGLVPRPGPERRAGARRARPARLAGPPGAGTRQPAGRHRPCGGR